jgi:hypothetical protein
MTQTIYIEWMKYTLIPLKVKEDIVLIDK